MLILNLNDDLIGGLISIFMRNKRCIKTFLNQC